MPARGLARIGLKANPFDVIRLDPVNRPIERARVLDSVDGFRKLSATGEMDAKLAEAVETDKPLYCLVTGPSGAGRTTAANCILARHRDLTLAKLEREGKSSNKPAAESFLVRDFKVSNQNPVNVFGSWFANFNTDLKRRRWINDTALKDELERGPSLEEMKLGATGRYLAGRVYDELKGQGRAFGAWFDNVPPNFDVITTALEIFSETPIACVFTALEASDQNEKIIGPFLQRAKSEPFLLRVRLSPISGGEVAKVIDHRWADVTHWIGDKLPSPFQQEVVAAVFDEPRSIGLVLGVCRRLLERRLQVLRAEEPLDFTDVEVLREMVRSIEDDVLGTLND